MVRSQGFVDQEAVFFVGIKELDELLGVWVQVSIIQRAVVDWLVRLNQLANVNSVRIRKSFQSVDELSQVVVKIS